MDGMDILDKLDILDALDRKIHGIKAAYGRGNRKKESKYEQRRTSTHSTR
jgi:hypothetical protein